MVTAPAPIAVDLIDDDNYRTVDPGAVKLLASAIAADGTVHEPVRVYRLGQRYVLVSGHHRTAAVKLLGWPEIPAVVDDDPAGGTGHLLAAVAANVTHRPSLAHEDAEAFGRLVAGGMAVDDIATRCAKSPAWVQRRLDLLGLTAQVRPMMAARGFAWCEPLYGLSPDAQRACVWALDDSTSRDRWRAICDRARELDEKAAELALFTAGPLELATETWTSAAGSWLEDLPDGTPPIVAPPLEPVREQVVGMNEIAGQLGLPLSTVRTWRKRGRLPVPDMTVSGSPAWFWSTVTDWAQRRAASFAVSPAPDNERT